MERSPSPNISGTRARTWLMDSVTLFALARREIGLSAGEPATAKGYTPTFFSERRAPRTGRARDRARHHYQHGAGRGDGYNEPIADAVHGVLDGHIVMARHHRTRGLPHHQCAEVGVADHAVRPIRRGAGGRQVMATYADMEELSRLGVCRSGTSLEVDEAIRRSRTFWPKIRKKQPGWPKDIVVWRRLWPSRKPNANVIAPQSLPIRGCCAAGSPGTGFLGFRMWLRGSISR
jgi:flagellar biosynthesis/type III secretory pathway ATPase